MHPHPPTQHLTMNGVPQRAVPVQVEHNQLKFNLSLPQSTASVSTYRDQDVTPSSGSVF